MERLTKWYFEDSECDRPYVYGGIEYCGDSYEGEVIDKLAYYEDLEESGRLVELPCRIGDALYVFGHECSNGMKYNCEINGVMSGCFCNTCGIYPCTLHECVEVVLV